MIRDATPLIDERPDDAHAPDWRLLRSQALHLSGKPLPALEDCEAALPTACDPSLVHLEMAQCWLAVPDRFGPKLPRRWQ